MEKNALTSFAVRVATCIANHHLLPTAAKAQRPLLVALSGGADSVALLRVLLELGYKCEAAHCNFQLRGAESERDQQFVAQLCHTLNITLHTKKFDTHSHAATHHVSIEMAARDLRYEYFAQLMSQRDLSCVAVAHHSDDNAETILLNTIRGTGIRGLTGMAYRRDDIIRPLLDVSRQDIIDYLLSINQDYITDSSNLVPDVKRNIIRLRLMPILRELNPSIVDTLVSNAHHLADTYQHALATNIPQWEKLPDGTLSIDKHLIADRFVLHELLRPFNFGPDQIADIWQGLNGTPGALYHSKSHTLLRDRSTIRLKALDLTTSAQHSANTERTINLAECNEITIGNTHFTFRRADISEFPTLSKAPNTAILDAHKAGNLLTIRTTRQGDRFVPFGMKGSKLVSDYMTDRKFSLFEKEQQLVVTDPTNILWLVNQRPDNRYRVDPDSTKQLLIITTNIINI